MQVHYLEVVTPEVDATCAALAKLHDVTFGEPEAGLGKFMQLSKIPGPIRLISLICLITQRFVS